MHERIILHCDLNNFFASVSLLGNPTLYDLPVAVCGDPKQRHGIVLAKNEAAKRFGVQTAEAVWQAKSKCPDLVVLAPDYGKYRYYSEETRKIFARFTDLIEPFGIDEAWLDVTGSRLLFGDGVAIADRIRRTVKKELGLTLSVGVSFNKVFAKLGSDLKKPDATTRIGRDNFREVVWPLPIESLLFVGKNTTKRLNDCGIFTVGDITAVPDETLTRLLGKNGLQLKSYANGEDTAPVVPPSPEDRPKSVGRSVTPPQDITDNEQVWGYFLELAEDISYSLRRHGLFAGGLQVHIRTTALKVKEYSHSLSFPLDTSMEIARKGFEIFCAQYHWESPLRSVGLRAINLRDGSCAVQQNLFDEPENDPHAEIIERSLQSVRRQFGKKSLKRGRALFHAEPDDRPGFPGSKVQKENEILAKKEKI